MQKIAICIPTYNRHKTLNKIIQSYNVQNFSKDVSLNILDDCPNKNNKNLENLDKRVFYNKNSSNIGYASSFFKLFEITNAQYLIFSSDDDMINFKNIKKLLNNNLLNSSYDCISSTIYNKNKLYRGKKISSPIKLNEIRSASNHAPGLIYKKSGVVKYLKYLKDRISKGCYFTQTYPQVALFYACYLDKGRLQWHPINIVKTGFNYPSNIKVKDNYSYSHPVSRMTEFKSFIDFLENHKANTPFASKQILKTLVRHRLRYPYFIIMPYIQQTGLSLRYFSIMNGMLFYFNCIYYFFLNYLVLLKYLFKLYIK